MEAPKMHIEQLACALVLLTLLACWNGRADQDDTTGFVRTNRTHFILNGRPFNLNGFNSYWLMYTASFPAERSKVSFAFKEASSHGLRLVRTWAFKDGGFRPLQSSPGVYNEDMFQGLDYVISEAKKHGVYLILSLVNNFNSFGGKRQYIQWAIDDGHFLSSDDDFFRDAVVKSFYKNHVKTILTRMNTITGVAYKDEPAIFAWELINEPRCGSDLSGSTLRAWIEEMAGYVKSIDSNHLLEVGHEGFYGVTLPERKQVNLGYEMGTDFIGDNLVQGIDFATIHAYPDQWMPGSTNHTQMAFLRAWLRSHFEDADAILGKPLLITEFGKSSKLSSCVANGAVDDEANCLMDERAALYEAVYNAIYASARGGGACKGGLFWQLLLGEQAMDGIRDGYEVIFSESPFLEEIISRQSHRISQLNNQYVSMNSAIHSSSQQLLLPN
ncbi:hypothetical protein Cni_G03912 [Canna indica]|uniref:mannan endo-1,4-beta-mannosidase n=1 Tax=Canna indica TaxID=4628 RepID=A0AAQ3Q1T0_9LILI|nr:hypothetical protein Cni_G03912 [Canna indica]